MLSDLIAPQRLRDGDPQALATLVAVAGWPVVAYCERAGAGAETAAAVALAFVTFRRRAIEAGDEAAGELEKILLDSARDAVDEVSGDAPDAEITRAAAEALARATPRPLTPRLASQLLRALVDAAPVAGDRAAVRAAAERSYADAYAAAEPAPAVPGEQDLAPASALLERAAQGPAQEPPAAEPAHAAGAEPAPEPGQVQAGATPAPRAQRPPAQAAAAALVGWMRGLSPLARAAVFAAALALVLLFIAALPGDDEAGAPSATETVVQTVTVTVGTPARTTATSPSRPARSQVVRGRPRVPLTASGARFEVVVTADATWAQQVRADEPRSGTNWLTLAVRTRNTSRGDLVLRTLNYRLRTGGGTVIGPRFLEVAEGPQGAREGRLPKGRRASAHLGFEIPFEVRRVALAFEPGGLDEPTVLVELPRVN